MEFAFAEKGRKWKRDVLEGGSQLAHGVAGTEDRFGGDETAWCDRDPFDLRRRLHRRRRLWINVFCLSGFDLLGLFLRPRHLLSERFDLLLQLLRLNLKLLDFIGIGLLRLRWLKRE